MKNIVKKVRFWTALVGVCVLVSLSSAWAVKVATANVTHSDSFTVVIDAGHGGIDGGVSGKVSGVKESDLNLDIAKKLKQEFEKSGINVVMTRNSYGGLYGTTAKGFKMRDMKKRIKIINSANADLMISVHLNYYSSSSRRGATVFFCEGKEEGERLAKSIQKHFNRLSGQEREFSALKGDYYLLNESTCPAVICECGFLSNEQDEKLLLTDKYREEIAKLIFSGAVEYLLG